MSKTSKLFLLTSLTLLASCKVLGEWADAEAPASGATPPVAGGDTLPVVGGSDAVDILVTILTVLGLAPAARLVGLARPLIAPLIAVLLGRKKAEQSTASPSDETKASS